MFKKMIVLISVFLLSGLISTVSAIEVGQELKVDFAYPPDHFPDDPLRFERYDLTAKQDEGWIAIQCSWYGDLWRHDPRWYPALPDGSPDVNGFGGSGIYATIGCGYEGDTSFKVLGLSPVNDGQLPTGKPEGDPIANSYIISHRHWGNDPNTARPYWGSIFLTLLGDGLIGGEYRLVSYHSDAGNPAQLASLKWSMEAGHDVMPSITVSGSGVTQIQAAYNVSIQHETVDAMLVPSEVKFETDGSGEVVIHYMSPDGYDGTEGGAAVLNAFMLTLVRSMFMAEAPSPSDGATAVPLDATLSWASGYHASSHDIYFGVNEVAVMTATKTSSEYKGSKVRGEESYDPGGLEQGGTYFWRIDEVNDANPQSPWRGKVWSFTTLSCLTADDMESYNTSNNWIHDTWRDWRAGDEENGAEIALARANVHGGSKAMEFYYANDWYEYSKTNRDLGSADWTTGTKALSLWFSGDNFNIADPVYVTLQSNDGKRGTVMYDNPDDLQDPSWHEWNIELREFAEAGVDLSSVARIQIGFTNVNGGSGVVLFDDIAVCGSRCIPALDDLAADLNGDCVVDIDDLDVMQLDWLQAESPADVYEDESGLVDLKDFAVLANEWLESGRWP